MARALRLPRQILLIAAATAVSALSACGSDNSGNPSTGPSSGKGWTKGGPLTVCNVEQYHYCTEYPLAAATPPERAEEMKAECAKLQGTLIDGTCPTANHVGTCVYETKNGRMKARYYLPITADEIRIGCQAGQGKYQPGY
jgi:hypothetical protein